jgi:nucleoside-diphosphate-sugar epimerase
VGQAGRRHPWGLARERNRLMAPGARIGVFGASGLVGSAVSDHLVERGFEVVKMSAPRGPRLLTSADHDDWVAAAHRQSRELDLRGLDAVVNAAGNADAVASASAGMLWPNALLPLALFRACANAEVPRFLHISSAAVQGRLQLDDSEQHQPHSAYARAKALGERLLLEGAPSTTQLVIYRPVGVHLASRPTTRTLVRLASSRLSVVARNPHGPSPQLTLGEVFCSPTPIRP